MNNPKIFLSAFVLISAVLFGQNTTAGANESFRPDGDFRDKTKWLKKNANPIKSLESEDYRDLKFLKKIIKKKRIVQLGEGGHGMKEYSQAKVRLIKFLHQEMGFEVVAFESSLYQCYRSDLLAGEASPSKSLVDCVFGVWHTKEVLPLFEYIKKSRETDKSLDYIGFDIQPIGRNKKSRPDFLKNIVGQIDLAYSQEVFDLDSFFLKEYGKKSRERRKSFREHRGKFITGYQKLAGFLEDNHAKFTKNENPKDSLIATQTAKFLAQYIRQQTAPDLKSRFEIRDRGMAQNIDFIVNRLYPDKKIVIWGHNAHVRYKNEDIPPTKEIYPRVATKMMGSWLKERYPREIYTVGFCAFNGSATNNARKVYQIADAKEGMLEAILNSAGRDYLFVDLLNQKKKKDTNWMFEPIVTRYNSRHPQKMVISDQYDAMFFVKTVSPPDYLY